MAKRNKEPNKYLVEDREKRIKNCKQCSGAPPTKACNLQGLKFNCCEICLEIVGKYTKEGEPIKVQTREVVVKSDVTNPTYKGKIKIEQQTIIPGTDFNEFKLI